MVIGATGSILSELGFEQDAISQSVAEWGVYAGIIIGGIGAASKLFEVLSTQLLKWMEYRDKKGKKK